MKKWFLVAFLGILSSSAVFFSCQKETAQAIKPNIAQPHVFSAQEQNLLEHLKTTYAPLAADRRNWWKIIGADLLGGLAGGAVGSTVPAIGTTAGFIIGALGTSLKEAGAMVGSPGGSGGQPNPENPFDAAGFHHNAGLEANWADFNALNPDQRTNEVLYGYGEDYAINVLREDVAPYRDVFFPPVSELLDLIATGADIPEIMEQMVASGSITPIMAEVCTAYYESVIPLPEETFYATSVRFEADVLNSDIEDADKNVILGGLAIGRYSRGFWGVQ